MNARTSTDFFDVFLNVYLSFVILFDFSFSIYFWVLTLTLVNSIIGLQSAPFWQSSNCFGVRLYLMHWRLCELFLLNILSIFSCWACKKLLKKSLSSKFASFDNRCIWTSQDFYSQDYLYGIKTWMFRLDGSKQWDEHCLHFVKLLLMNGSWPRNYNIKYNTI